MTEPKSMNDRLNEALEENARLRARIVRLEQDFQLYRDFHDPLPITGGKGPSVYERLTRG